MTENEAKTMLEAYLKCKNEEDAACYGKGCDRNCDECDLTYMQGTSGQHKEAIAVAIKALEKQIPQKVIKETGRNLDAVIKEWNRRSNDGKID